MKSDPRFYDMHMSSISEKQGFQNEIKSLFRESFPYMAKIMKWYNNFLNYDIWPLVLVTSFIGAWSRFEPKILISF